MENFKKAPCTIVLAAINITIFFVLTMFGATEDSAYMLGCGAMYVPYLTEQHEYYRIFTSMFLHYGFNHLIDNMLMLAMFGWHLERKMGTIKYIILYLVSGLCGQFAMIWYAVYMNRYVPFAGASGAVFGVIGALLYVAIRNRGRIGPVSGYGLLIVIIISIYYGFTTSGVANPAHIGGLFGGLSLAAILYREPDSKSGSTAQV